jgi:hypothetical protein
MRGNKKFNRASGKAFAAVSHVEVLESRQLMSGSGFAEILAASQLLGSVTTSNVTGGLELNVNVSGGQSVSISQSGTNLTVSDAGLSNTYKGDYVELVVDGISGNNTIQLSSNVTINAVIQGGSGNDTLIGGGGADTLYAGTGNDLLEAGSGTDTLIAVGSATDTLQGGSGLDSFWDTTADTITGVTTADTAINAVHTLSSPITLGAGASLAQPSIGMGGVSYKAFNEPLFSATGPSANDIIQGDLGDCYFLADLSAIAQTNPNQIRQDVVELSDGTFLVRFMNGNTATYEHLNNELPANSGGNLVYAQLGQSSSMWVPIMEKAFAEYRNGANSYPNIAAGWMSEVSYDLGLAATDTFGTSNANSLLALIQSELQAGDAVTIGIDDVPAGSPLIDDHAYSVVAVTTDGSGDLTGLEIRNPWGTVGVSGYASNGGYVTITPAQAFAAIEGVSAAVV